MNNKNLIGISALIIALSVGYYFVFFVPQRDYQKLLLQKQEQEQKKSEEEKKNTEKEISKRNLDLCLGDVTKRTSKSSFEGMSLSTIKVALDLIQKQKDECFKKYPQ